tara:strand:+ start:4323 stop:4526 length:204 start_codon:yes stop_codon:yes gene_type:complete
LFTPTFVNTSVPVKLPSSYVFPFTTKLPPLHTVSFCIPANAGKTVIVLFAVSEAHPPAEATCFIFKH